MKRTVTVWLKSSKSVTVQISEAVYHTLQNETLYDLFLSDAEKSRQYRIPYENVDYIEFINE